MRDWSEFDRWSRADDMYLPRRGQGETMATQIVTATTKLVYKWFNDGDVYDNTRYMDGWCNDLSSYANWLAKYAGAEEILDRIWDCMTEDEYTEILYDLCESLLDDEDLEAWNKKPAVGDIYDCEGDYRFEEPTDDEEEEYW